RRAVAMNLLSLYGGTRATHQPNPVIGEVDSLRAARIFEEQAPHRKFGRNSQGRARRGRGTEWGAGQVGRWPGGALARWGAGQVGAHLAEAELASPGPSHLRTTPNSAMWWLKGAIPTTSQSSGHHPEAPRHRGHRRGAR